MAPDDHPSRRAGRDFRRALCSLAWAAGVAGVLLLFFGEFLLGGRVYYPGDIARLYLPLRSELTRALDAGRLPWWSERLGAGYPLLAEGEAGALYPPNWLTALLWPGAVGLSASIVGHYVLAGGGLFAYLRALGRSVEAALVGALAGSLGGFYIAHLSHPSILSTAAWLPWLFYLSHRVLKRDEGRRWPWRAFVALALVGALHLLAGHAQVALLGLLPLGVCGLVTAWPRLRRRSTLGLLAGWAVALLMGALLAAPQLAASIELGALSQRAGGLADEFFMSYSFHPLLSATLFSPFALGNPYPEGSVELMGYLGLMPLGLAAVALLRHRDRVDWFYAILGAVGLALAFGRWNPVYPYLRYVPVLNLFRVPARYLYWVTLAIVVLAAKGFDVLVATAPGRVTCRGYWALGAVIAVGVGSVAAGTRLDTETLIAVWRYLPLAYGAAVLVVVWGARWLPRRALAAAVVAVACADLYAYGAVLDRTYNAALDAAWVDADPASAAMLAENTGLYRVYTKEEIIPALEVQRESLYPNMAVTSGVSAANVYAPLLPRHYADHLANLTPTDLSRLNVRYYLIPQLLPVDDASELYDVYNPFSALPVNVWVEMAPVPVAAVWVESFLSHAAALPDGALAAEVLLREPAGKVHALPLRAGRETGEWAYQRSDVSEQVAHRMPSVAHTYPARSGFPPEDHPGHVYGARFELSAVSAVSAVQVRLHLPEAFTRVERVALVGPEGNEVSLGSLVGQGEHRIVYRSEHVLIYRNEDVWPRAYAVTDEQAQCVGENLTIDPHLRAEDVLPVDVVRYEATEVILRVEMGADGYVVLADLAYPGWYAQLNGRDTQVLTVDGLYRGVWVPAGVHEIQFAYRPPVSRWLLGAAFGSG